MVPRSLIAFSLFLILTGGGVGAIGLAQADEGVFPGRPVELRTLELPAPHLGDRVRYEQVDLATGKVVPDPLQTWTRNATWLETAVMPDRDGDLHRTNVLQVAQPGHEEVTFSSWLYALDQETRHLLVSGQTEPEEYAERFAEMGLSLRTENLVPSYVEADHTQCELQGPFIGRSVGLDAAIPSRSCTSLHGHGWQETTWHSEGAFELDGHTYVLFGSESPEWDIFVHPLRMVFRTDLPYPVSILLDTSADIGMTLGRGTVDQPRVLLAMTGFQRGEDPLPSGPYAPLPSLPVPRTVDAVRHRVLDDGGIQHEFPFQTAFETVRDDPEDGSLRDILAAFPDAYALSMGLFETIEDGTRNLGWAWRMVSGDRSWYCLHMMEPEDDISYSEFLRLGDEMEMLEEETACDGGQVHGGTFSPAPRAVLSIDDLIENWDLFQETAGVPAGTPSYGFTNVIVDRFTVGMTRQTIEYEGILPPEVGTTKATLIWAHLSYDPAGEIVELNRGISREEETWFGPITTTGGSDDVSTSAAMVEIPVWVFPSFGEVLLTTLVALLLAILYWLFPFLKQGVLTPLFSRIDKDRTLDQEARAEIMAAIESDPGVHQRELARRTGVSRSALRHHLDKLSTNGLIRTRPAGRTMTYWPAAHDPDPTTVAVLQAPLARQVHELLREEPSLSVSELARRLGQRRQTVAYHVKRLREAGIAPL